MKLIPILLAENMQETMDFYIPLGFEARDVMQNGDEIESMKLIYKDNEDLTLLFYPAKTTPINTKNIAIKIEEAPGDIKWHQKNRYTEPEEKEITDPNGYKLIFAKEAK